MNVQNPEERLNRMKHERDDPRSARKFGHATLRLLWAVVGLVLILAVLLVLYDHLPL